MSLITWECLRYVQGLTTILGPQNRTQGSCVDIWHASSVHKLDFFRTSFKMIHFAAPSLLNTPSPHTVQCTGAPTGTLVTRRGRYWSGDLHLPMCPSQELDVCFILKFTFLCCVRKPHSFQSKILFGKKYFISLTIVGPFSVYFVKNWM